MITVRVLYDRITPSVERKARQLSKVVNKAYATWVKVTPKRTGNAKRRTKLENGDTIHADYKYAVPLEKGHSKQAPQGMFKPTLKVIKQELDKIFRIK